MSSPDQVVYTGFWHDHGKGGHVLGSTLTLNATHGSYLLAFLAIFITFTGSKLWNLVCFVLHQYRSTVRPRGALHQQQQVTLRNNSSSLSTLWSLLELCWAWRSKARRGFLNSSPLILVAAIFSIAFAAAAILSARIANVGGNALVVAEACGWIAEQFPVGDASALVAGGENETGWTSSKLLTYASWSSEQRQSARDSFEYVRSCYLPNGNPSSPECIAFAQPYIPSSLTTDKPCPFSNQSMCLGPVISVDSGLIDSNRDLGLNTERGHEIQYRRILTCAPIVTEPYSDWQIDEDFGFYYLQFYYNNDSDIKNSSTYSMRTSDLFDLAEAAPAATYALYSARFHWNNYTVGPISELITPQADLVLVMKTNVVSFTEPVYDAWFKADPKNYTPGDDDGDIEDSTATYYPALADVLGCTTSHQICDPASQRCTTLSGLLDIGEYNAKSTAYRLREDIGLSDGQHDVVSLLGVALIPTTIERLTMLLYDNALLANDYVADTHRFGDTFMSAAVPNNQTAIEVQNWHNAGINYLQRRFTQRPRGPSSSSSLVAKQISKLPLTSQPSLLCSVQKVRNAGYTSFSVAGVALVLSIGLFFILLNFLLPYLIDALTDRSWSHKRQEWVRGHLWQLHRSVYENQGIGGLWVGSSARSTPITYRNEKIEPIPLDRRGTSTPSNQVDHKAPNLTWSSWPSRRSESTEALELIQRVE
ncbi:MAG: hypothetical protein M1828_006087 [Chrysothrix sp. TS-e1954]|nr:MAG: hypothetical protein M1828_006087 [Chrysothrix sp. TS-e1954]